MGYTGKVLWREGMLLSPHHLQQQDNYHEQLLQRRVNGLSPFSWGLTALSFDTQALAVRRVVVLTECRGFLPWGSPVNIGSSPDDDVPMQSAPIQWEDGMEAMDIVLALPRRPDRQASGTMGAEFVPRRENIPDQTGPRELSVEFMKPDFKLLLGSDYRSGYESLKLAELRLKNGKIAFSEEYVPPLLTIQASTFYTHLIDTVLARVHEKRAEILKIRALGEASIAPRLRAALLLGIFGECVPALSHYHRHRCHPEQLYLELARLAGRLAETASVDIGEIPSFDHDGSHAVFSALSSVIARALGEPLARRAAIHSVFTVRDDNHVAAFEKNPSPEKRRSFYLGFHIPADGGESEVVFTERRKQFAANITNRARVCAAARLAGAKGGGKRPIELARVRQPPDIAVDDEYLYFELTESDNLVNAAEWNLLEQSGEIGLWFPHAALRPHSIDLWVC